MTLWSRLPLWRRSAVPCRCCFGTARSAYQNHSSSPQGLCRVFPCQAYTSICVRTPLPPPLVSRPLNANLIACRSPACHPSTMATGEQRRANKSDTRLARSTREWGRPADCSTHVRWWRSHVQCRFYQIHQPIRLDCRQYNRSKKDHLIWYAYHGFGSFQANRKVFYNAKFTETSTLTCCNVRTCFLSRAESSAGNA